MVLTFESVDEILWFDHSNESYKAVLDKLFKPVRAFDPDEILTNDH